MRPIKKLLLASAATIAIGAHANAADLPYKAAPPPIAAPVQWTWSGIYIGGHLGGGFGNKWWSNYVNLSSSEPSNVDPGTLGTTSMDGFLGGVQAGVNWQVGQFVLGAEGTWSWTDMRGQFDNEGPISDGAIRFPKGTASSRLDWIATFVGRVGVVVDRALVYAGGGVAWTRERDHLDAGSAASTGGSDADSWDGRNTKTGVTFLTGVEYAISPNWSARIQYNYYDFGTATVALFGGDSGDVPGFPGFNMNTQLRVHAITAGVNFKFNWGLFGKAPVVARY
jgi:outer membrane immunogenic protein